MQEIARWKLQFNRKITTNETIQKNCLKHTKSDYNLAPVDQGGGHSPIKQWLQSCQKRWSCGRSGPPVEVRVLLWMSSGGSGPNTQIIYPQIQAGMLSTSPRAGSSTLRRCSPVMALDDRCSSLFFWYHWVQDGPLASPSGWVGIVRAESLVTEPCRDAPFSLSHTTPNW